MIGIDYLRALRHAPSLLILLRPDEHFTIVDATDAYLRETHTRREAIVERGFFEVFQRNPSGVGGDPMERIRASFERVARERVEDTLEPQRYDMPAEGGGFSERWWRLCTTPLLDASGEVELLLHAVHDATALVRLQRVNEARGAELVASEVLESIAEGFFGLDREWRFTYVNREARRILGAESASLVGRVLWDAYPGLIGSAFETAYRAAMDEGRTSSITSYYPDHDRWYEVYVYPAPNGVSIYFRNVTRQKQTEAERERLAAETDRQRRIYEVALSNTPDLVYVFGTDHRFLYANESLLAMWGKTREESMGKTTLELGYPAWEAELHDREIDAVIASKKPIQGEVPFEGTGGVRYWDYIFAPVIGADGEVVAIAGTARDSTERRRSEQAKDEFIATLSHELRNPLAPLRNAVALLGTVGAADDRTAALHRMMERQVNHLVRLVDDLLEISRVSRGDFALRLERTALSSVVRNALETSEPLLHARKHRVNVALPDQPVWVEADPVRLAQVVGNLVDNAAKYTPEGGRIDVSLAREGDEAVVRVRDNGSGIEADALQRIFEMFNRGDRREVRSDGGLGIGLALARRLAEMHGGTLHVASEGAGRGSEFTLRMPVAPPPAAGESPRTAHAASVARRRILVVDDNRDAADTLGMVLAELGAEVRVAHDGEEAIEVFGPFDPAAVLLDIGMPRMDGYEVARALRGRYPDRHPALIALTGWGQAEDRNRARDAGFDHHIVKPAELEALRALLASIEPPAG